MEANPPSGKMIPDLAPPSTPGHGRGQIKFELAGFEELEKVVARSGKSGRVYLPTQWCGKRVKIIRLD